MPTSHGLDPSERWTGKYSRWTSVRFDAMESKVCCLQILWSLFLVFSTVQFMTFMYPSYHAQPPLDNQRQVETPSKGVQTATETPDAVEHFDSSTSHPRIPVAPVATKLKKLGLATEPMCFGKSKAMSPAQFWDQAGSVGNSYPPAVRPYVRLLALSLTGVLTPAESRCGTTSTAGCQCKNRMPLDPLQRWCGKDWPPHGYTMVGLVRLRNVADILWQVIANAIPGDFAELGVWRGGTCIFAKSILDVMGENRLVHVFDAFGTIPDYSSSAEFLAVPIETVMNGFHMYDAYASNMSNVFFYKGLFKDTLPGYYAKHKDSNMKLAVLRVDGNFHDSYQDALYYLYGFVPVGGFVIFDDVFSHKGAMQAWKEFKEDHGLPEELTRIDIHSGYFRKTRSVSVDFTKMRPSHV